MNNLLKGAYTSSSTKFLSPNNKDEIGVAVAATIKIETAVTAPIWIVTAQVVLVKWNEYYAT